MTLQGRAVSFPLSRSQQDPMFLYNTAGSRFDTWMFRGFAGNATRSRQIGVYCEDDWRRWSPEMKVIWSRCSRLIKPGDEDQFRKRLSCLERTRKFRRRKVAIIRKEKVTRKYSSDNE